MSHKKIDSITKAILTYSVLAGFFLFIYGVLFVIKDQKNQEIAMFVGGTLGTILVNLTNSYIKQDKKDEK